MIRNIVVFERDERYTDSDQPELDFRLLRSILPRGSAPLAIADRHNFQVRSGQWFDAVEVKEFAESLSGYRSE